MTDDEYCDWLLDQSRNAYRVMLIECDHSAGTIYLASRPYVSSSNQCYDDWLLSMPYMETNLDNFAGIGDFRALNLNANVNWTTLVWHGYECRWLYGDLAWQRSNFRRIGSQIIKEVKALGRYAYQFDLLDIGERLNRSMVTSDTTRTGDLEDQVEWIAQQTGVSISLTNISSTKRNYDVTFDVTPSSKAGDILRKLARSINCKLRPDQLGNVEIFTPSSAPSLELNEDIGGRSLQVREVIPPYVNVTVIKADGTRLSDTTNIDAGQLENGIEYDTYLTNTSQANAILAEYITYHANPHHVWGVPLVTMADLLSAGTVVTVRHAELTDTGLINRITRSPLTSNTEIEVLI